MKVLDVLLIILLSQAALFPHEGWSDHQEITEKQLKKVDAAISKERLQSKEYRVLVSVVQMALAPFGFGTGPFHGVLDIKTRTAIRNYQEIRKLRPTGEINAKTYLSIIHDAETWVKKPLILPRLRVFLKLWDQGYVRAQGTWTISSEKLGVHAQTTEIECHKEQGYCFEATADIYKNELLTVDQSRLVIERWDQHEITTKPEQSAVCVRFTMRIGRAQKSVTGLRLRTKDTGLCKGMPAELQLKLVDGDEVTKKLVNEQTTQLKGLLQAPGFESFKDKEGQSPQNVLPDFGIISRARKKQ